MGKRIYFVAGEASGDEHGAALLAALRARDPEVEFTGRGGPRMQALARGQFRDWIASAAVVGLWEVLRRYSYFRREFHAVLDDIAQTKPDAVVLIDYPGFNLRLARALRRRGDRLKIIFYISPQVWAWNRRRIPQMARYLDLMLCIFPFEAELYNRSGLRTIFVGHPMLKNLAARREDVARDANLIALLPGSRAREIRKILPVIVEAARLMRERRPQLKFEVAAASPQLADEMRTALAGRQFGLTTGNAASLMQRASVGLIASGTATLEAAYFRLPFVLVYKVSWPTYLVGRAVVTVPHLGMPNVLAGREIVPEFVQHNATPEAIAAAALELLNNEQARARMTADFDEVIARLGDAQTDSSAEAAGAVLHELQSA